MRGISLKLQVRLSYGCPTLSQQRDALHALTPINQQLGTCQALQ